MNSDFFLFAIIVESLIMIIMIETKCQQSFSENVYCKWQISIPGA